MDSTAAYKYLGQAWKDPDKSFVRSLMKDRVVKWRNQPSIVRIDVPTRLDRARALGYKSKGGFVAARIKVRRGGSRKRRPVLGRRQKRMGVTKFSPAKSLRLIAEERVSRKFPNLEVLNSYFVWKDGAYKWFEIILVDPHSRSVQRDAEVNWISKGPHYGRSHRGLTSAGRKSRGLR
ncbi:50S ribosomal protein L15e [Candidatus Bathyarchaeota archaeon]|nr:50S ribosomal protein L15e [Candidatus Bathyarchaeota archaeon]